MPTDGRDFQVPAGRPAGWQQDVAVRVAITTVFTGVQVWAIVLAVLHVQVAGAERAALAAALAAAAITVLDAWRDVWALARHTVRRRHLLWAAATAGGPAEPHPPGPR